LLLGGDKREQWNRWHADAIPLAEEIYSRHLRDVNKKEQGDG